MDNKNLLKSCPDAIIKVDTERQKNVQNSSEEEKNIDFADISIGKFKL